MYNAIYLLFATSDMCEHVNVPKYDEWRNSIQWFSTYYFRLIHIYKHTIVLLEESYLNLLWYSSTISRICPLCSCTYCSKLRSSDVGRLTSFTASFNALFFLCGSDRLRSHAYRHMTSEKVGRCWQTVCGWVSKHSTVSYVRYNFPLTCCFSNIRLQNVATWNPTKRSLKVIVNGHHSIVCTRVPVLFL